MVPRRVIGKILPALLLCALPAVAQESSYAVPGSLGERRLDLRTTIKEARDNARWSLGFLDLEPQLSISDLGYVSNIYSSGDEESESDLRATGNGGLRGFFNLGPKVLVSPFASLSYSWWKDQDDLRTLNESYGLRVLGDFNRLTLDLQAGRVESQRNLSSEVEVPVDSRNERVALGIDVDFWGPFRFFGGASTSRLRFSGDAAEARVEGLELANLDVDRDFLNAGLAYQLGTGLEIALGVERVESDYPNDPGGRSNQGTGPLIRVSFAGTRLFVDLDVARRDIEFDARPGRDRRQVSGLAQLEWRFTELVAAGVYGGSQLQASALEGAAVFENRRTGVFLQRQGSRQGWVRVFYETGRDEFEQVTLDGVFRVDDFTSYGVTVRSDLTPRLSVDVGYFDSRRESTDPRFDRDYSAVRTVIRLGGNLLPW